MKHIASIVLGIYLLGAVFTYGWEYHRYCDVATWSDPHPGDYPTGAGNLCALVAGSSWPAWWTMYAAIFVMKPPEENHETP